MKVKDLPGDTDLTQIKIRIPDELKHNVIVAGLNTQEVYLRSAWGMGVWVKTEPGRDGRMYPITGIQVSEVRDWEVVD